MREHIVPFLPFTARSCAAALGLVLAGGCEVRSVPGDDAPQTAYSEARPGLEVSVVDEAGAPVVGAWVALSPGAREAQTDADGVAQLDALGQGSWTAVASLQGYAASSGAVEITAADAAISLTLVAVPVPDTTLAGLVSDLEGLPLAGAEVWIDDVLAATTGEDGRFEASGLVAGARSVRVEGPADRELLTWEIPALPLEDGARAEIGVTLGGSNPDGARYVGSTICAACHGDLKDSFTESAHYGAGRDPEDVEDDDDLAGLSEAFLGGSTVDIDELGASATLSRDDDGVWRATLTDAWGDSSASMAVVEVYGGHRGGAVLAVDAGDTEALFPLVWAMPGQGLSSQQDEAGWVSAWTDGWFDAEGRLELDGSGRPGADASFALQCAGCHVTSGVLSTTDGHYALEPSPVASSVESRVGCESCHGPGSVHASSLSPEDILSPGRMPAHQRVEVCARCHERVTPEDHPFADTPGYAVYPDGALLGPTDTVAAFSTAAPVRWLEAPASRVGWDQVGDLRSSPHLSGDLGYAASCEDCHDPHGSDYSADLRVEPWDNTLCTTCHAADFPSEAEEAAHSHHGTFHPGAWSPGSCTGCHMPRLGVSVRPDAVSGAGELHAHTLDFVQPAVALAEFDALGVSTVALGEVPVNACLDCHLQVDAEEEDAGSNCPCPVGSPTKRSTYEDFQTLYDVVWGLE